MVSYPETSIDARGDSCEGDHSEAENHLSPTMILIV